MKYLTKSRFKLALQCLTKLYYTGKENYADNSVDDPFLEALADGGFQVGELAKYVFADDPETGFINVKTKDLGKSLQITSDAIENNKDAHLTEAAFSFESLFVRVDILEKRGNLINIYEVKSKSIDGANINFVSGKGAAKIKSEWVTYLYDLAFQYFVLSNSDLLRNYTIVPHLILVDKSKVCAVDGMNQMFTVVRTEDGGKEVIIKPGIQRSDLDTSILKIIDVSSEIDGIINEYVFPTNYRDDLRFREFVGLASDFYSQNERIFVPLSTECRGCQFVNRDPELSDLQSGFHECWHNQSKLGDELRTNDLVTDIWGALAGGKSIMGELLNKHIYLIKDINEIDIAPKKNDGRTIGLSPHQRRMQQINRVKTGNKRSYFDREGFLAEASTWAYPLHMIDFETAAPAIPFNKNKHPYEGIAFQFSHHTIEKDGTIKHAGEYISFEKGVFPNYEFVRNLKKQLEVDNGSIFRYHNHENTFLNLIYDQLDSDENPPDDIEELQEFIRSITSHKDVSGKVEGLRNMIDLYQIIIRYYYSPSAKGSNSIKKILPAMINDSEFLREKYSKPIYGKGLEIPSLNFENHIWIDSKNGNDPYRTLPTLFDDYDDETLDKYFGGMDELKDGGAAMTAYGFLQYSDISHELRVQLRDGLLRYCELDTMAMVMLVEGLFNKAK
jgi:hypothetical protein